MIRFYHKMLVEKQRLEQEIAALQSQVDTLANGKLICRNDQGRVKWYVDDGTTQKYIPNMNRKLAEQLAARKYLLLRINELKRELSAVLFYLRHADSDTTASTALLEHPTYRELLTPFFQPLGQKAKAWAEAPFETNSINPESLIHKTPSGHLVRSKSEAIIDTCLYLHSIPFRYECALHLPNSVYYPDFTIMHPDTGELYYWEHLGLADVPGYYQKNCDKIQNYIANDIVPSVSLILTWETKSHPLSADYVEELIHYYFL